MNNYIEFLHNCYVDNIPLFLNGNYHYIEYFKCIEFDQVISIKDMEFMGSKYVMLYSFLDIYSEQLRNQMINMKIEKIKNNKRK
jgi:hypothetical protein